MKSVVVILIDALSYENFKTNEYRETPMPFLNKLAKDGVECSNMYSIGPYTEAAIASCICGEKTLDNNGYLRGIADCPKTLHEVFKNNGYKTYATYSPYIYSESYIRGIDEYLYSRFYDFSILIDYRLTHFREKYMNGTISHDELIKCADMLKEGIRTWKKQLYDILNNDESTRLIIDFVQLDNIDSIVQILEDEYQKIEADEIAYIKSFFDEWDNSILMQTSKKAIYDKQNKFHIAQVEEKFVEAYTSVQKKQNTSLRKNMPFDLKYFLNSAKNNGKSLKTIVDLIRGYQRRYSDTNIENTITGERCKTKVTVSARRQLDYFAEKIEYCVQNNEDNYTFIHLEDFHAPSMFFSYDIKDTDIQRKELEAGIEYANNISSDYRGNLLADLSARYVDNTLKDFVTRLKDIEDINFVFMADHGFAFNFNPPRAFNDTSFYLESYHIPLVLWGRKDIRKQVSGIFSSRDIVKSVIEYAGLEEKVYEGLRVVWKDQDRDFVMVEYCGPGCPDFKTSRIHYILIDKEYFVGVKAALNEEITPGNITKIFDLKNDRLLINNLAGKIKGSSMIDSYLDKIRKRHMEIKERYIGNEQ